MKPPPPIRGWSPFRTVTIEVAKGEIVAVCRRQRRRQVDADQDRSPARNARVRAPSPFDGEQINGVPQHVITARGIAYVPENRRLFPRLSVDDNLRLGSYLYRGKPDRDEPLKLVFDLFPRL